MTAESYNQTIEELTRQTREAGWAFDFGGKGALQKVHVLLSPVEAATSKRDEQVSIVFDGSPQSPLLGDLVKLLPDLLPPNS